MGRRLLIGLLKGLVLGGAVGAALHFGLEQTTLVGALAYVLYGAVGALTGVLAGKAFWKPGAWIEAVLRGAFGVLVGCGLYALASRFLAVELPLPSGAANATLASQPLAFAPLLSTVYAVLLELDNDGKGEDAPAAKVRAVSVDDIHVDEEEAAPQERQAPAQKKRG